MNRRIGFVVLFVLALASQAVACGDKFLAGQNNPSYAQTHGGARGGLILLYRNPSSVAATNVLTPDLKKSLEKNGHKVKLVETQEAFDAAIKEAKYDVVSADAADLAGVKSPGGNQKAVSVPVMYNASWADVNKFKEMYKFVLEGPNRTSNLNKVVNDALREAR